MRPGGTPSRTPGARAAQSDPAAAVAMSGAVDLAAVKARSEAQARAATAPPPTAASAAVRVTQESLQSDVLDRSFQVPVLLVVVSGRMPESVQYAESLEPVAQAAGGAWILASIDIDAAPDLARSLQVRAVPTVFAVIGGQVVPGFEGALPADQLPQFIDAVQQAGVQAGLTGAPPADPDTDAETPAPPVDARFAVAEEALEAGDFTLAAERYQAILAEEPGNEDAKLALLQTALLQRLAVLPADAAAHAEAHPDDVTAVLAGADALLAANRVDELFTALLAAFRRFAGDEREQVRTRLVEYFEVLGPDDPRVPPARRRLAAALF